MQGDEHFFENPYCYPSILQARLIFLNVILILNIKEWSAMSVTMLSSDYF